jgi:cell division protein FtsZ
MKKSKEIKPDIETFAKIKVVGVGGSGGSAINRMIDDKIRGVEFIAVNTDAQALSSSKAKTKVQVGVDTTRGLGAGMDPDIGARSAEENIDDVEKALADSDMVFITCGLGGGTGTGAAPIIADIARNQDALTVAVVTKPFNFEGAQRKAIAERGLDELESRVDTIITIPNDRILSIIDRKTSLLDSFKTVDDILHQGIQGISEIITVPGLVNVDFADVKAIMADAGSALMGIGKAAGEDRAKRAAKEAVDSPLLDVSIAGAKGILFTVTGGEDLTMFEVNEIAEIITASADGNAKIIFGTVIDESMKGDIKVMVIATGFESFDVSKKSISKGPHTSYTPNQYISKNSNKLEEEDDEEGNAIEIGEDDLEDDLEEETTEVENELDIPAFIRKKMK